MGESGDVEFSASLGMDGFPLRKREAAASHGSNLRLAADEVHLDRGLRLVPSGLMGERHDVKVASEFAIYAAKKIEIELRGDAAPVIVCGNQCRDVFAQVDSDDRLAVVADMFAHPAKQRGGFGSTEIAQRRPRKKRGARMRGNIRGNVEIGGEIRDDRVNCPPKVRQGELSDRAC